MTAPLTDSWEGQVISSANLDKTTHGSGTTAVRTALGSWSPSRLFFDTTDGRLYRNAGTKNNVIWELVFALEITGIVKAYAGAADNIPAGYLLCDGRSLLRTDYPALFSVIGTAYTDSDNIDALRFSLPNLVNWIVRGATTAQPPGNHLGQIFAHSVAVTGTNVRPGNQDDDYPNLFYIRMAYIIKT